MRQPKVSHLLSLKQLSVIPMHLWRRQWKNDPLWLSENRIHVSRRFGEQVLWRVNTLVPCDPKGVHLFHIVSAPYAIAHLPFLSNSDAAEVNHPNRFLYSSILLCPEDALKAYSLVRPPKKKAWDETRFRKDFVSYCTPQFRFLAPTHPLLSLLCPS